VSKCVQMQRLLVFVVLGSAVACSAPAWQPPAPEDDASVVDDVVVLPFDDAPYIPYDGDFIDVEVEADLPPPKDAGVDAAPGCGSYPDGTVCKAAPDACHDDGKCSQGKCLTPQPKAEGYNWKSSDPNARCCAGVPVTTNSNSHCGACGIKCNGSNSESCQILGGRYFCRGCVASLGCWSGCCSTSFVPYTCSASDCKGNCDGTKCPVNTTCKLGLPQSSNYCGYP